METEPQYDIGRVAAGFMVDESGRTVAELADTMAKKTVQSERAGVLWDGLGSVLVEVLPDEVEETPKPVLDAVEEILKNPKKRIKVLDKLVAAMTKDPDGFRERLLSGTGTAEEVAELVAGVRMGFFRSTNDASVIASSKGVDKDQLETETEYGRQISEIFKELHEAITQLKASSGDGGQMGEIAESIAGLQRMMMSGGGDGLNFQDPAFELKMFEIATKRIVEELAGIDRLRMNLGERTDWVRQTSIWFMSNGLLRRYIATLANETTGSFEWATYIDQMNQGSPKAIATWDKLDKTFKGGPEEMGGMGAEMADGVETDAMIHNMGVEFRVLHENGREAVVKYSLERMWNYYLGNYPREGLRVEQLPIEEVRELFAKYGELIRDRYGADVDPMKVWGQLKRMGDYRRDLDFVRNDAEYDKKTEETFQQAKVQWMLGELGWYQMLMSGESLEDVDFDQMRRLVVGGNGTLAAFFEMIDKGEAEHLLMTGPLEENDPQRYVVDIFRLLPSDSPLREAVQVYLKAKTGGALDSREMDLLRKQYGETVDLRLLLMQIDNSNEVNSENVSLSDFFEMIDGGEADRLLLTGPLEANDPKRHIVEFFRLLPEDSPFRKVVQIYLESKTGIDSGNDQLRVVIDIYKRVCDGDKVGRGLADMLVKENRDNRKLLKLFEDISNGVLVDLPDTDPLYSKVTLYKSALAEAKYLKQVYDKRAEEMSATDFYKARFRVHRGEKFSDAEWRFVNEILKQEAWISAECDYQLSSGDKAVNVRPGEMIIPWFVNGDQIDKIQEDVTAFPRFAKHNNPFEGPLLPAWSWATRKLGNTRDVGPDDYINWELAEAGVDVSRLVAVELPRRKSGAFQTMVIEAGGKRGGVSKYEVGLLSSGGLARLGEQNAPYLREFLYEDDDVTLVRDGFGNEVLAPMKNEWGEPMYEYEVDRESGKPKDGRDGRKIEYQKLIGPDGKVVVDSKGRPQYRPKLDERG